MTAYLFDIDGVLTDPVEKQVTHPELLELLSHLLEKGNILGFNTGRAVEWAQDRLIDLLVTHLSDETYLQRIIVIGEKGEVWKVWDEDTKGKLFVTKGLAMPEMVREKVKELIDQKYSNAIMPGEPKHTMVGSEMKNGYDLEEFKHVQKQMVKDLKRLLRVKGLDNKYGVTFDTIGINVEHKHVGKALGTKRFLQFLKDRAFNPSRFKVFGDAKGDLEMADVIFAEKKEVTLVYTGEKVEEFNKKYPIVYAQGYSRGTLEYLQKEEKGVV